MTFAHPLAFLLLPLALLPLRGDGRRPVVVAGVEGWRGAPETWRIRWLRRLPVLRALAAVLMVVALAGPRFERLSGEEIRQGVAIELLVDISSSMDQNIATAGGARITRMEAAKEVVEEFLRKRPNDLIGLITFARYADTHSPLTFGHAALIELVRALEIQDLPNEDGTAYGDALSLACARLGQTGAATSGRGNDAPPDAQERIGSRVVVLLTDGENNCGLHLPEEAGGFARKLGIRVHAISMKDASPGVAGGAAPPETSAAEILLDRIASETGGCFWKIGGKEELERVYAEIDRLETSRIRSTTFYRQVFDPVYMIALLPAFLLVVAVEAAGASVLRLAEGGAE
jgi:Ca-activated chloride channel family protein